MSGRNALPRRFGLAVLLEGLPVLIMVSLVAVLGDEFLILGAHLAVATIGLSVRHERYDGLALLLGLVLMTLSETVFVQTGVETFSQHSLFGLMPLWLPVLWGYGFVAIKRVLSKLFQ